jgi:acyl-CoA thioester hydrolase
MTESPAFDLPSPFVWRHEVVADEIDEYNHVNNAVYVRWLDSAAWEHSAALGLPVARCVELDRGMAVVRSVIGYLRPALLGDTVEVATWLLPGNGRLRVGRRFQVRRAGDGLTLARAEIEYACIELASGRPTRWPAPFHDAYAPLAAVVEGYAGLAPL